MKELTTEEQVVLEDMEDHRYVSESLENAFIKGGLSEFKKFVLEENGKTRDKHKKLAILLRGNNNKIIVYKDNHKIWELSTSKVSKNVIKFKVSFDFNHARYSKDWPDKLDILLDHSDKGLGFDLPKHTKTQDLIDGGPVLVTKNKKGNVIGGEIGTISCTRESFDGEFVKKSYSIISGFIDDFFKSQDVDYFREKISEKYPEVRKIEGSGSANYVEKRWQQRLLFHFDHLQNGYYAYDLEFSQKFPDADYVKKYAKKNGNKYLSVNAENIKKKLGTNEPDMLAIKFDAEQVPEALVLIEVKSTESACKGKTSGVEKHMMGMDKYSKQEIFMKKRREDAYKSLCQYKKMGIIKEDIEIKKLSENISVEKVLLLTNANVPDKKKHQGALKYFEDNKSKILKWSKKYDCKVWTTNSNYWDPIIKIKHNPFCENEETSV